MWIQRKREPVPWSGPLTLTLATTMPNPSTPCSIAGGSYFVATFSSTRIAPNTCPLAASRPATIYPWWQWAPRTRCLFVSRRNTCGHSLNICEESVRPGVVRNNIPVWMASSDYRQPEPTTLPECTTVESILASLSQS